MIQKRQTITIEPGAGTKIRKGLIVNADDFGLTEEINTGIIDAHQKGIVTSVSLMPTGSAFDHAVTLLRSNTDLDVGVHLTLTHTAPVLPKQRVPTLVNAADKFHTNWPHVVMRLLLKQISIPEVEREWDAQIMKIITTGIRPTHLDSHQHLHIFPELWNTMKALSQKHKIQFIRYPVEKNFTRCVSLRHFLKWLCIRYTLKLVPPNNIDTDRQRTMHFLGLGSSGKLDERNLTQYLSRLNHGVTELMCHPGDIVGSNSFKRWGHRWHTEREALTNPEIIDLIKKLDVNLTNYRSCHG